MHPRSNPALPDLHPSFQLINPRSVRPTPTYSWCNHAHYAQYRTNPDPISTPGLKWIIQANVMPGSVPKIRTWPILLKICYDKAGNLPKKGRNFNTQTWGKIVYFLFVWLVGIDFRQNFFRVLPNFGDFGAKMSFFHYIINQNRNNFIKHCSPPPCTKKPLISEMCNYIKSSLCKWGLGTRGGGKRCSIDKKPKGCRLKTHKIRYSQWKITSIVHILIKACNFA